MKGETSVSMPQMGESLAEGTIVKWKKRAGDRVERDEPLLEISTDKVDTEIPSPASGWVAKILVEEGVTVPIHTPLCVLADAPPGEVPAGAAVSADSTAAATAAAPGGAPSPAPLPALAPAETPRESAERRLRERSSPLVRRLAAEHGIPLGGLTGSGASGRVTKEDILGRIEALESAAPAPAPAEDRLEPMSILRQKIAEHMVASRRTSAHVTSVFEVDMTAVRVAKDRLGPQLLADHGVKLTYLPFVARQVCLALREHPLLNASVEGTSVRYHAAINIGVAVALEDGLIVPVVRGADRLGLVELARAIQDVAERARQKRLKPEDVQGATFTITNPGIFGSVIGTPIISQPQVGILCLGAVVKRAVVIEQTDSIAVRSMAFFSLSFDHRLIDGAVADRFLARIRRGLEAEQGSL